MKKLSFFRRFLNKFWIRKDREIYLLGGLILVATINGFVTSYWHYLDRMEVISKINIDLHMEMEKEKEFSRFKEAASYSGAPQEGKTQYYKLEKPPAMTMPSLYKEKQPPAHKPANDTRKNNTVEEEDYSQDEYEDTYEEN